MGAIDLVIYKYPLEITDEQTVEMPVGASPLSVQFQQGHLVLWAAVALDGPRERRTVNVIGTGNPWRQSLPARYVGTAQEPNRPLVWHVYISESERPPHAS